MGRKIIDAREGKNGNIEAVKFEGNTNFTNTEKAIEMTKNGKVDGANVSISKNGNEYLRTNPNGKTNDNLDTLAKK